PPAPTAGSSTPRSSRACRRRARSSRARGSPASRTTSAPSHRRCCPSTSATATAGSSAARRSRGAPSQTRAPCPGRSPTTARWRREYGGPHAEVDAIAACSGEDLSDATLYVSIEPCCHDGKTPPCTEAILQAGLRRVVVASDDPSEKASGRGLGILRDEGVE